MSVLVKFRRDWSDEFDVYGFRVFDSKEAWITALEHSHLDEEEFYFGTNEGWGAGEITLDDFTVTEITSEDANVLMTLFKGSFGTFPV